MPTKEEYEKIFNELLGTDIRWSKLSREELAQLAVLFANPEILCERLGASSDVRERFLSDLYALAKNWEGPVAKFLRKFLGVDESPEE